MHFPLLEVCARLGMAVVAGGLLGINRQLRQKPIGLRTLSLVALGACMLTLATEEYAIERGANSADAASRVAQGIVSGIGFLGAGVILRGNDKTHVHNMTTAATIWISSTLGVACALARWPVVLISTGLTFLLLVAGESVERFITRGQKTIDEDDSPDPSG
jgi:putative Mg2+ transporter-C (MgtC) family protein